MEKWDSTDDVFANAVAIPTQNARKQLNRPPCEISHASSKNALTSCLSMTARNSSSLSYYMRFSLWSDSTSSIYSSIHVCARCSRFGAITSSANIRGDNLTSCAGKTSGASCARGRFLASRSARKLCRPITRFIAQVATSRTTSSFASSFGADYS